jgi:hypothetical protein
VTKPATKQQPVLLHIAPRDGPALEPWTPGPLVASLIDAAKQEPECALATLAFIVGLVRPRHETLCAKVVVACLESLSRRKKAEGRP